MALMTSVFQNQATLYTSAEEPLPFSYLPSTDGLPMISELVQYYRQLKVRALIRFSLIIFFSESYFVVCFAALLTRSTQ